MRFVRHLLVVSSLVMLVVALGFVWRGSGAAGLVADGRGDRSPSLAAPAPTGTRLDHRFDRRGANGISLSNIDDLLQTLVIEGLILGGVVGIDNARRRRRRAFSTAGSRMSG